MLKKAASQESTSKAPAPSRAPAMIRVLGTEGADTGLTLGDGQGASTCGLDLTDRPFTSSPSAASAAKPNGRLSIIVARQHMT